jgi:hypothetical protein
MQPRRQNRAPITMELVREKCIEDGDCLIWQAAKSPSGAPYMKVHGYGSMPVRRWIAGNVLGLQIDGRMASTICGNSACVEPEHVEMKTRSKMQRDAVKRTQYHLNPVRNQKLYKAAAARSPYSKETVEKIRAAEGSQRSIARDFGVSFAMVNRIKNGQSHRNYSSPWAGL